ncbi:MAG TPA: aminoglycoside phosphotransferase family protein [Cyclobacteriaceae bacterium]|nr:aminoglycoside phosphotransferase family protein [Cyclobacteriaceae bacterium]
MNAANYINVLAAFGLDARKFIIKPSGSGHIHQTFLCAGTESYILQKLNTKVFSRPEQLMQNILQAADCILKNDNAYPFSMPLKNMSGDYLFVDEGQNTWRLFKAFEGAITIDEVKTTAQAYSAAKAFGKFAALLWDAKPENFHEVIPGFHNLALRYKQFEQALDNTSEERKQQAKEIIGQTKHFYPLVEVYNAWINSGKLQVHIMHNDTKINNVLFNAAGEAFSVIDLDTLMPGYFIYDLGDMVRTFVSPVSEEGQDLSKVIFRKEIYDALLEGYLSEMQEVLTADEQAAIPFAGKMMSYIMALRFLADYLNGDIYYPVKYEGHNLMRAKNQLHLLSLLPE